MKLAAKFARQETEKARLARISRRRISKDREEAVRRMLTIPDARAKTDEPALSVPKDRPLQCLECARVFKLPMHWARHRKARHRSDVG